MEDKTNQFNVSATFLKNYITLKKETFDIDAVSKAHSPIEGASWLFAEIVTIPDVKAILINVELSYTEFITAYCEHLKNM